MRGAKPKPRELRKAQGIPESHGKYTGSVIEPVPLGKCEPPAGSLCDLGKAEYYRIMDILPEGLLSTGDLQILLAYCRAVATCQRIHEAWEQEGFAVEVVSPTGVRNAHHYIRLARETRLEMLKYATEFGLTPSARARSHFAIDNKKPETEAEAKKERVFKRA